MKKKILMLGTGGTIASKKSEHGLTPGLSSKEVLSYIPQVAQVCDVDTLQVCSIDSTNITPSHWAMVSRTIELHYEDYDGFVICHGTDTLAYTASALSYMIQNSNKPIVITGSQKPIDMEVTDAKTNLLDSFIYASDEGSQGIDIVFDGKVIFGTRAKKVRAKSYNAFSSINFPYPAIIQDQRIIRYFPTTPYEEKVTFYHQMKNSVFVLKLIPGIKADILSYIFNNYDCIVIESFGVGGIPESILKEFYVQMAEWKTKGKIVVMTTQVANEGSNMTVYQVGEKVKQDFNLMEAYDMTLESTITKLMWLMALPNRSRAQLEQTFYQMINHDILFKPNSKEMVQKYEMDAAM
ncbi:MAG: asparaginase [Lachnospiraceae bacterium]